MCTKIVVLSAALIIPNVVSAQMQLEDMYFGAFGGAVFGVDAKGENDSIFPSSTAALDFDPNGNYIAGLVLGARVAPQVRAEFELSYSSSDVDGTSFETSGGTSSFNANGDLDATSFLINAWYEFETNSAWRPYVGGGIGYTSLDAQVDAATGISRFDDSDGGFSYQIGFGATIPVGNSGEIDIGYRYRETPNLKLVSDSTTDIAFDEVDYKSQTLQIGYNYKF